MKLETDRQLKNFAYVDIGECYQGLENYTEAIKNYTKYLYSIDYKRISASDSLVIITINAFVGRALCKTKLGDYRGAIIDLDKIIPLIEDGFKYKENINNFYLSKKRDAYFHRGLSKMILQTDREGACKDMSVAGELGEEKAYDYIKRYCWR